MFTLTKQALNMVFENRQAVTRSANDEEELDPIDRAIIEDWRRRGYMRPLSRAESAERFNNAADKLRKAFERFENRFFKKDIGRAIPKDGDVGN